MAAPLAYMALKMLGSLYLTWLGLCLLWNLRHRGQVEDAPAPPVSTVMATWRLGFVTNLANPKTAVFVASLFSATLPPGSPWSQGPIIIAIMMAISIVWYVIVAAALSRAHTASGYRRWRRWIDAGAGLIFVGFGLKLAFTER
jgi:threonine/homoserine/homoserine lactone efflux protein